MVAGEPHPQPQYQTTTKNLRVLHHTYVLSLQHPLRANIYLDLLTN